MDSFTECRLLYFATAKDPLAYSLTRKLDSSKSKLFVEVKDGSEM